MVNDMVRENATENAAESTLSFATFLLRTVHNEYDDANRPCMIRVIVLVYRFNQI